MVENLASSVGLPASVVKSVQHTPVDDIALAIIREAHPDIPVFSKIPFKSSPEEMESDALVVVRHITGLGLWEGREGLLNSGALAIHVFSRDPDGELKGALVSEAIRNTLLTAARNNWYRPGLGALSRARVDEEPSRQTDWAPSQGPVQYADLPTGFWRHESRYMFWVRPPSIWA